jgi:hypothetical protein
MSKPDAIHEDITTSVLKLHDDNLEDEALHKFVESIMDADLSEAQSKVLSILSKSQGVNKPTLK